MTELVGHTPLPELRCWGEANGWKVRILAKLEYGNPAQRQHRQRIGRCRCLSGIRVRLTMPYTGLDMGDRYLSSLFCG